MKKIEHILCPVDFSEFSSKAYDYAQSLAWHYKSTLLLQHVLLPMKLYGFWDITYEETSRKAIADAERQLQKFARCHTRTEIRPEYIVQDGSTADLILALAEARAASIIVMGTHGLRGIDRLMLGSVSERVLRFARCPVLAVRKVAHHAQSDIPAPERIFLKKIVLCEDFSDHAHHASEYAFSLAEEYGAELTLLHVLEDIPISADLECANEQAINRLHKSIPPRIREWCAVKEVVRIGKPYQQILQFALETQTDLVVMGVRGRSALDTALFGSTTHRVIQLGSCPVLAVHL